MKKLNRLLIIIAASVLLIILIIPSIIIFIAIYFETGQFPIFIQTRGLTLNKEIFKIYKFRTIKDNIKPINPDGYICRSKAMESAIYPFGRFLRETGLDEIPQLINIIKGEMVFVGPRPLNKKDLLFLKGNNNAAYKIREKINRKPGITGWWQVQRNIACGLKYLVELDKYYDENKSLTLDLSIIIRTIHLALNRGNKESFKFNSSLNKYIYSTKISVNRNFKNNFNCSING